MRALLRRAPGLLGGLLARIPERRRGVACVSMAALLWSTSGIFIKGLTLGPFPICFWRSLVAAATLALALRLRGSRLPLAPTPHRAASATTYAGVLILFVTATKLTTAANAIFLQFSAPIYLLFLEPWLLRKPFHRADLWAVGACMAGMSLFFAGHLDRGHLAGNLLGMLSGVALALWALLMKAGKASHQVDDRVATIVHGNLLVALLCLPMVLRGPLPTLPQAATLLYLGVFQLGIAYLLFTLGMRHLSATAAMITSTLEAVFNPVWVFLGLGERPSPWALLGGLVILAVIAVYSLREPSEVPQVG